MGVFPLFWFPLWLALYLEAVLLQGTLRVAHVQAQVLHIIEDSLRGQSFFSGYIFIFISVNISTSFCFWCGIYQVYVENASITGSYFVWFAYRCRGHRDSPDLYGLAHFATWESRIIFVVCSRT